MDSPGPIRPKPSFVFAAVEASATFACFPCHDDRARPWCTRLPNEYGQGFELESLRIPTRKFGSDCRAYLDVGECKFSDRMQIPSCRQDALSMTGWFKSCGKVGHTKQN